MFQPTILEIPVEHLRMTTPLERTRTWWELYYELKSSDNGPTRPLLVKWLKDDHFDVIDGNKRLSIAFLLGVKKLRCELVT